MSLTVTAPALARRDRPDLAFEVADAANRFVAVEVAADWRLLGPESVASRTGTNFWASWMRAQLDPPGAIVLPADVWMRLRIHDRLWYRAQSSSSATTWDDYAVTVPDGAVAEAPALRLCECWVVPSELLTDADVNEILDRAAKHPQFPIVADDGALTALVCLHRFSPRRPSEAQMLEWVALLEAQADQRRRTLVQRFRYDTRDPIAAHLVEEPTDQPTATEPEMNLVAALETEALRWSKRTLGPFTVFQDNAPLPGDEGGTCITLTASSRCVYFAWTSWSGQPEAIVPR
jgi:hypothetical protein